MDDDGAGDFSFASTSSNPLEASYGSSSPASFASTRATSVWSSANKSSAWDDDDERPLKRTKLEGEANLGDVFTARRRPVFGATWGWNARADTTGDDRCVIAAQGLGGMLGADRKTVSVQVHPKQRRNGPLRQVRTRIAPWLGARSSTPDRPPNGSSVE